MGGLYEIGLTEAAWVDTGRLKAATCRRENVRIWQRVGFWRLLRPVPRGECDDRVRAAPSALEARHEAAAAIRAVAKTCAATGGDGSRFDLTPRRKQETHQESYRLKGPKTVERTHYVGIAATPLGEHPPPRRKAEGGFSTTATIR